MDDALYDEATRRRIDGGSFAPPRKRRQAAPRARMAGSMAFMGAVAMGLQQVFDPPKDEEIVLEVDTSGGGPDDEPVTFDYDPTSVARSRAHVRPWLFPQVN